MDNNNTNEGDNGGKRKMVSIPNDMVVELAILNDLNIEDDEMMYNLRQFVATFAKKVKDQTKDLRETRLKMEATVKKTE